MSIFPSSPNIGDQYSGYEWDGTAWKVIGIDLNVDYATAQELTDALADTTGVHGIADTSTLETQSGAQSKADAAETAANSYTDNAIASFEALPDQTGHSGEYLTTDGSVTSWGAVDVSGEIATHNADTTDVHGIADTSALVVTTDSRLSDARTPTAHASSHASGGSDAVTLAISQVTGLQTALDGKVDDSQVLTNVPLGAVFTDTTTNETITLSGDVSGSGTSSIVVTVADDSHNHIIGNVDGLQTALDTKAPLASPTLTGTPTAPTAVSGTNTTQIATTAFVASAVSGIIDSAPTTLDTLNELAAALGDDPNFATTVTNLVATKQPLDADLTAIAGLTGTSGLLKKTAADTWTLDTTIYQPSSTALTTSTSFGGDVSGTYNAIVVADDSHTHQFNNLTNKTSGTGEYSTDSNLTSGRGSGGVSLTINDGYGNANVTWNHKSGIPEQNGNAARIEVNTDSTSGAFFSFELKSNVVGGVAVNLSSILELYETTATFFTPVTGTSFNSITGLSSTTPIVDGTAAVGTSTTTARADHVHPTDTSRLAASSYTASDVLTKIKTVDGSGSGLDADLLDGQDGSYYQPSSTALTTSTNFGGDVSGTYSSIIVSDDSHNHIISNIDNLQTTLDGKVDKTGDTITGTLEQSYLSTVWSHSEAVHRPLSNKTISESGYVGTTGSNITDVYGEADVTGITGDVTFTYSEVWDVLEAAGARLPTLAEVMDGVGKGSGQGYDAEFIWTCTPAGPHHVWVVKGSYLSTADKKIVDITDPLEVYRTRAFFDVSRNGRQVYYSHDGNVYINNSKVLTEATGAGGGFEQGFFLGGM